MILLSNSNIDILCVFSHCFFFFFILKNTCYVFEYFNFKMYDIYMIIFACIDNLLLTFDF